MVFRQESSTSGGFVSQDPTTPSQWTEATTVNETDEWSNSTCVTTLVPESVNLIIAPVGLTGNAVVLWLLGFQIHTNAISIYILNLAVADFLFLSCLIISTMMDVITAFPSSPAILNKVTIIFYTVGLSILSAISTERCLSVLWPIWYHCHRPRHMSAVICALLWALSLILNILQLCFLFLDRLSVLQWWKIVDFIIVSWLFILLMILCVSSLALLVRMFCSSRRMPLTRLYVTVLITVLVFLICGLPFGISWFLVSWFTIDTYYSCYLHPVTVVLCCVNSCTNPIIYFFIGSFRQQRQQRTLKLILQRALQDSPAVGDYRDSNPHRTLEILDSRMLA
ncbi:mas-related G-protein coupled receptor member X1-like [Perognathus longimembris pacificus]|uniref:mas-related G-protein coupled receptor member X1-like n=1 Tax=Perognathus longimembris pacificus TaxID=214514 RepID=UPI0020191458|nr:mas-related G-protein coupled receptor member X1-like [Perognathus longimembris pacificus]